MKHTIALLAGVSFAALLTGVAYSQTPLGLVGESTVPQILEDATGHPISVSGNVDATGKVTATYGDESNYHSGVTPPDAAGNVLYDNTTHSFRTTAAGCPSGNSCLTVNPATTLDPNIKFAAPTYSNEFHAGASAGFTPNAGTTTGIRNSGDLVLRSNGTLAYHASQCTVTDPCTFVAPTAKDPKATLSSLNVPWGDVKVNPGADNAYSLTPGGTPANRTQTMTGGVVYSNSTSQATTAGPGGVQVIDTAVGTTTVTAGGVSTTGTVQANAVVAETGSFGVLSTAGYADVGATLTSYGDRLTADETAIKMLGGQVAHAQDTANKALSAAAITAALPQLHFAPGDWLSVGVGGADAGGTGAWALAAGALVRPNIMLNIKGGMSGNTGVIAGGGSISFGGGYSPLK